MAEHLASIFGTEKDRVNCPFYFKIGACRHGDRCSRLHNRPTISPTLLLSNMYQRPDIITPGVDPNGQPIDPRQIQQHFEDFYEDIFLELSKFGYIETLNVCDNLADHMIGNVYVLFREEDHAAAALASLHGRFYSGRPILADFSPVTDFREATCRQYEENSCNRGGYCNFMHVKKIGRELRRKLFASQRSRSRSRSRSNSPRRRRSGDRGDRERRDRDRDYESRGRRSSDRDRDRVRDRDSRDREGGGRRRNGSSAREGSEERRARIEQWNREREEKLWCFLVDFIFYFLFFCCILKLRCRWMNIWWWVLWSSWRKEGNGKVCVLWMNQLVETWVGTLIKVEINYVSILFKCVYWLIVSSLLIWCFNHEWQMISYFLLLDIMRDDWLVKLVLLIELLINSSWDIVIVRGLQWIVFICFDIWNK